MTFVSRKVHGEEGVAAVEFGLIAGLLFMILLGIFQLGQIYSRYQVLQGAAREGARYAATRASFDQVRQRVVDAAQPFEVDEGDIAVSRVCDSASSGESVTVSWNTSFEFSVPFLPQLGFDKDIKGVFRCE
jgi:Flp pilus assembly protein TadG